MLIDAVAPIDARNFAEFDFADADLFQFAAMTVVIEVPLFYLCGWRKLNDCIYFAGVNIITNLLLNEFLELTDLPYSQIIIPCEIVVVLLEFALCSYWFTENRRKLLYTLIFTNSVSFLFGLLL